MKRAVFTHDFFTCSTPPNRVDLSGFSGSSRFLWGVKKGMTSATIGHCAARGGNRRLLVYLIQRNSSHVIISQGSNFTIEKKRDIAKHAGTQPF